jgi:isoquinoline 1-oxidoreductase beta subunit
MSDAKHLTVSDRREFLKGSVALAGGVALTLSVPLALRSKSASAADRSPDFSPNAFIRIDRQGVVTLVMPMVEMGQGTYTQCTRSSASTTPLPW